jgi:hypothetical protein
MRWNAILSLTRKGGGEKKTARMKLARAAGGGHFAVGGFLACIVRDGTHAHVGRCEEHVGEQDTEGRVDGEIVETKRTVASSTGRLGQRTLRK